MEENFDYQYLLKLTAEDADGNTASTSKKFLDLRSEVVTQLRLTAAFAGQGFPASLLIRSVFPSGKFYPEAKGQLDWIITQYDGTQEKLDPINFNTDKNGRAQFAIPTEKPGQVQAVVRLWDKQEAPSQAKAEVVVFGEDISEGVVKVQELSLLSRRDEFDAGEVAKGLVMLPEAWGPQGENKGWLYITVAGEKIFSQRVQKVEGLATWIEETVLPQYGTGFYVLVAYAHPQRGWIERQFSFRIPQRDKTLQVQLTFEHGNAMPGEEQKLKVFVKDHQNNPLESEVSISVVDQAVLALQPEFRPDLLDFFYPMSRLNLTSFFSSHFQSYGYGEELARLFKPNYWYSATKSEQDKLQEDDTAYWTAHLITNNSGVAETQFRMPANQTLWEVTAIAIDKKGRFGEGRGQFRSQMPVTFHLGIPQFLRLGDQMHPRVNITNTKDSGQSYEVTYELKTPSELSNENQINSTHSLKPGEEIKIESESTLVQLPKDSSQIQLSSHLSFSEKNLSFAHSLKTMDNRISTIESPPLSQESWTLTQSTDRPISSFKITLSQGLLGTLLPSLRWLISYPHGCVEQTLSKTIPSLVLREITKSEDLKTSSHSSSLSPSGSNLFEKLWHWGKILWLKLVLWVKELFIRTTFQTELAQSYKTIIGDSEEYSTAGLKKIAQYQNENGSFAWFLGDGEGDRDMTLSVMMMLMSFEKPKYDREGLYTEKAWRWLSDQYIDPNSEPGIVKTYIQSRLNKAETVLTNPTDAIARINQMAELTSKGPSALVALALLSIDGFGIKDHKDIVATQNKLIEHLKASMVTLFSGKSREEHWRPLRANWTAYPGRDLSDIALSLRALNIFNPLDNELKSKYMTLLLNHFNGSHFGSTFETSMVLLHSAWLLKEELQIKAEHLRPQVRIGDNILDSEQYRILSQFAGWEIEIPGSQLKMGDNTISTPIKNSLAANLSATRLIPSSEAKTEASGWTLNKSFYAIEEGGKFKRPIDLSRDTVKVGDLLFVELEFQHLGGEHYPPSHFLVRDDIPAGFVALEDDSEFSNYAWYDPDRSKGLRTRRIEQDHIVWYFRYHSSWMVQQRKVGYFMRATYGGEFSTGVGRVEDFYDENSYAQTSGQRLRVAPYRP